MDFAQNVCALQFRNNSYHNKNEINLNTMKWKIYYSMIKQIDAEVVKVNLTYKFQVFQLFIILSILYYSHVFNDYIIYKILYVQYVTKTVKYRPFKQVVT